MNHTYRLVWNELLNAFVAVSELTKGRGKRASLSSPARVVGCGELANRIATIQTDAVPASPHPTWLLLPLLIATTFAQAADPLPTTALPTGAQLAAGQAAVAQTGARMDINQSTDRAILNWQSFNIGQSAHVNFVQPSAAAVTLNRVVGGDPSQILGRMTANGQVFLSNPNGIYFGKNAQIDVAGLVATTHNIRDQDFMAGRYDFNIPGKPGASVINEGSIRVSDTGIAAFVAPSVANRGVIAAKLGKIQLAAANGFTLDFHGDDLLSFMVDDKVAQTALDQNGQPLGSFVESSGRIEAQGGFVWLTAKAAEGAVHSAINHSGVIEANRVDQKGGVIVLSGGEGVVITTGELNTSSRNTNDTGGQISVNGGFVALGGEIKANGSQGGQIQINARGNLSLAENVSAHGLTGAGGGVSYQSGGQTLETGTSHTDVSGATDGGSISMNAKGGLLSSGQYKAHGETGQGGRIDLTGENVRLLAAQLDASGATQGGLVRIGGEFQGGKTNVPLSPGDGQKEITSNSLTEAQLNGFLTRWGNLPTLERASKLIINDTSVINVSANKGAGGTAIVWADKETTQVGKIYASGEIGGFVEISSADTLRRTNLLGVSGAANILLDPANIIIGDTSAASNWVYQAILGKGYSSNNNMDVTALEANDRFGFSVSLNAAGDRLAVGTIQDDASGNSAGDTGVVYLFSFIDNNFSGGTLQSTVGKNYVGGKNVNLTTLSNWAFFGQSVALNAEGDRLAVGSSADYGSDKTAPISGAVYLINFSDNSFNNGALQSIVGKGYTGGKNINVSSLKDYDQFGTSVSLNAAGNRLAVGAWGDDGADNLSGDTGAVYLFSFDDNNFSNGSQQSILGKGYSDGNNIDISELGSYNQFGAAVSFNATGDRLAIGAHGNGGKNQVAGSSGAVYLFGFDDNTYANGKLIATIGKGYDGEKDINVAALESNDYFGRSVSLSGAGDRMAVGAYLDKGADNTTNLAGAVYIFNFTDSDFSQGSLQTIIGKGYSGDNNLNMSSLDAFDLFGISVSLNAAGDRLAIGAAGDKSNNNSLTDTGAVYLLKTSGSSAPSPIDQTFGVASSLDIFLSAADIATQLSNGTSLTLQANNDITVNSAITVNNPNGNGGDLKMQAGRSIYLNADITTDNGNLTLIANENGVNENPSPLAIINAYRESGRAEITQADGATIYAGTGNVNIRIRDGVGLMYQDTGDITLHTINAGTITAVNNGTTSGSGIVLNGRLTATGNSGTAIELAGQQFNNHVSADALNTPHSRWLVWSRHPQFDTRGDLAYGFKQYDAIYGETSPAEEKSSGLLYSHTPVLNVSLDDKIIEKPFDGTARAKPLGYLATGAIDGDKVKNISMSGAHYDSSLVGDNKLVTVEGITPNLTEHIYGYRIASSTISKRTGRIVQSQLNSPCTTVQNCTEQRPDPNNPKSEIPDATLDPNKLPPTGAGGEDGELGTDPNNPTYDPMKSKEIINNYIKDPLVSAGVATALEEAYKLLISIGNENNVAFFSGAFGFSSDFIREKLAKFGVSGQYINKATKESLKSANVDWNLLKNTGIGIAVNLVLGSVSKDFQDLLAPESDGAGNAMLREFIDVLVSDVVGSMATSAITSKTPAEIVVNFQIALLASVSKRTGENLIELAKQPGLLKGAEGNLFNGTMDALVNAQSILDRANKVSNEIQRSESRGVYIDPSNKLREEKLRDTAINLRDSLAKNVSEYLSEHAPIIGVGNIKIDKDDVYFSMTQVLAIKRHIDDGGTAFNLSSGIIGQITNASKEQREVIRLLMGTFHKVNPDVVTNNRGDLSLIHNLPHYFFNY